MSLSVCACVICVCASLHGGLPDQGMEGTEGLIQFCLVREWAMWPAARDRSYEVLELTEG